MTAFLAALAGVVVVLVVVVTLVRIRGVLIEIRDELRSQPTDGASPRQASQPELMSRSPLVYRRSVVNVSGEGWVEYSGGTNGPWSRWTP